MQQCLIRKLQEDLAGVEHAATSATPLGKERFKTVTYCPSDLLLHLSFSLSTCFEGAMEE